MYNSVTTSPKTAGDDDFEPTTVDVTFQPGETGPKSIPINIVDDDVVEPTEEFTVTLSSSSPGVTVGEPATVFIKDNDRPGTLFAMSNNLCYTTIHINEVISLVLVRALLEYRSRMTSQNNKTSFFPNSSEYL